MLLPRSLFAQIFEDCQQAIPPFSWGGIDVNHEITENTSIITNSSPYELCIGSDYFCSTPMVSLGQFQPTAPILYPFIGLPI